MASASSEHEASEEPAKKPWSRPTFYVLTDIIQSSGAPSSSKTSIDEDETIPVMPGGGNSRYKNYRPATA